MAVYSRVAGILSRAIGGSRQWLVFEDDDFVNAEDSQGTSNRAGKVGLLVMRFCAGIIVSEVTSPSLSYILGCLLRDNAAW